MRALELKNPNGISMFILNLEPDELLLESIQNFVREKGIKNGCIVSGIGTLKKLVYHRVTTVEPNPTNEFLEVQGPIELSSMQGLVVDFQPHIHFVASDLKSTYCGHLENGSIVLYLAEVLILKLDDINLKRIPDEKGISFINLLQE